MLKPQVIHSGNARSLWGKQSITQCMLISLHPWQCSEHAGLEHTQHSVCERCIFNLGPVATPQRQTGYSRSDRQLPHSAEEAGEGERESQCRPLRKQPQQEHWQLRETQQAQLILKGQTLWLKETQEEAARSDVMSILLMRLETKTMSINHHDHHHHCHSHHVYCIKQFPLTPCNS